MRWIGVQHRPPTAMRKKNFMKVDGQSRKMGRSKRTWMDVVKIILKKCNQPKDLGPRQIGMEKKIHVVEPNMVRTML